MKNLNLFCNDSDENAFWGFAQHTNWADLFGKSLSARIQIPNAVKTLSLFSGAGGLDIGFHDVGFNITEVVEIESSFVDSIRKNSGSGKYFDKDIKINCMDIIQLFLKPKFFGNSFIL